LAEQRLELEAADQIPPWFMHTTDCYGGLTLGAFAERRLVGYSYAVPGFDGARPFLLSCGLAVAKGYGARGIGEALKRAQAARARRAGYDIVRWTTNSLASLPLHLYLSKLGARLVRYREDMYGGLRASLFPDEVEIEWDLRRPARPTSEGAPVPLIASKEAGVGLRRLGRLDTKELASLTKGSYSVEIPWDRWALGSRSPEFAVQWVAAARTAMQTLLAGGFTGTSVIADRSRERSFVRFDRL
jgi:predicted GNAT superfamily acetyltransferase